MQHFRKNVEFFRFVFYRSVDVIFFHTFFRARNTAERQEVTHTHSRTLLLTRVWHMRNGKFELSVLVGGLPLPELVASSGVVYVECVVASALHAANCQELFGALLCSHKLMPRAQVSLQDT